MADGDHYASYADVQNLLSNAGIGTAGNTLYSDTSLEIALDISQAKINFWIYKNQTTTKVTGNYADICKGIQIDLIMMRILQSRQLQENNLADAGSIQGFWSIMPQLTFEHKSLLNWISAKIGVSTTYNYNMNNGERII